MMMTALYPCSTTSSVSCCSTPFPKTNFPGKLTFNIRSIYIPYFDNLFTLLLLYRFPYKAIHIPLLYDKHLSIMLFDLIFLVSQQHSYSSPLAQYKQNTIEHRMSV